MCSKCLSVRLCARWDVVAMLNSYRRFRHHTTPIIQRTPPHHTPFHTCNSPSLPAVPSLPAASTLRTYLPSVPACKVNTALQYHIKTYNPTSAVLESAGTILVQCIIARNVAPYLPHTGASSPEKAAVPKIRKKEREGRDIGESRRYQGNWAPNPTAKR